MDYKIRIIRYMYYLSLAGLLILYLFPGSLLGYLFYGDFGKQPHIISNPIGTSINHTLAFFYLSILGLVSYIEDKNFNQVVIFLFFLSIFSELLHLVIPNRFFQFLDLFGNLFGMLLATFIIIFYKKYK